MGVNVKESKIAQLYRHEVDKQDINQREMASAINVSAQLLSHMLNGRRNMGLERVVDISEYLQDPDLDFEVAAELFGTPRALKRKRRDNHPISKMVGQDKEEMERMELEKKYEIWDLLTIPFEEIRQDELQEIELWLIELKDEISSEIAVFNSVCNRYLFDSRKIIKKAETRERND